MGFDRERRAHLIAAAATMMNDAATPTIVAEFRRRGVPTILLKGPALGSWLYDKPAERSYGDIDLLVPQDGLHESEESLRKLGFEGPVERVPDHRPWHARTFIRRRDGVVVDLHQTLDGIGKPPSQAWSLLAASTEDLNVGGSPAKILVEPARAFVVALHAAHHGPRSGPPLADLTRALARVVEPSWEQATELARALDAVPAFATGLRLLPEGATLADRLRLPQGGFLQTAIRADEAPGKTLVSDRALVIQTALETRGLRNKARFVARELFPAAAFMREWSPRLASRGWPGIGAAYVWRLLRLAGHAGPAVYAWRRAVRRRA